MFLCVLSDGVSHGARVLWSPSSKQGESPDRGPSRRRQKVPERCRMLGKLIDWSIDMMEIMDTMDIDGSDDGYGYDLMDMKDIYIYIYIPSGPQVSARGGVGWGMLTSCSWYVDGWGGVGHVNVILCYVDGWGGVEWGMLRSCSWYVDGWGGVGHVNVMLMVRWWEGWGGAC